MVISRAKICYVNGFESLKKSILCNADTLDTGQIFKPMVRGDKEL